MTKAVTQMNNALEKFDGSIVPASNRELSHTTDVALTREAQEVQAAIILAKRFPRDESQAYTRIMNACKRTALAEEGLYSFPRGGAKVEGASIRLAEMLAQTYGNIDYGMRELERNEDYTLCLAYAWDLESNNRQSRTFTVPHELKAHGKVTKLTDPRDIRDMVSNIGSRMLRSCVLKVIPSDVVRDAEEMCRKTLEGEGDTPLSDKIKKMAAAFSAIGVTKDMLEARLKHKLEAADGSELVTLRGIYKSLCDGASSREQWFDMPTSGAVVTGDIDELEPGRQEVKSQEKEEHEADASGIGPDEKYVKEIKATATSKLREFGRKPTDKQIEKIVGFACIGHDIENPMQPETTELCKQVITSVDTMTKDDVNTALDEA